MAFPLKTQSLEDPLETCGSRKSESRKEEKERHLAERCCKGLELNLVNTAPLETDEDNKEQGLPYIHWRGFNQHLNSFRGFHLKQGAFSNKQSK